jgi:hypothetical protein
MLFSVCIIYVTAIAFMYFTNKLIIIFIIIKRTDTQMKRLSVEKKARVAQ